MPRSPSSRPASRPERANLYDEITARIIGDLEAGRLPWVQPWGSSGVTAPLAMPRNAATGRAYSGINVLILWGATVARGFSRHSWLTFRQALGLGGNVRKGERGTTVVYADRFVPEDEKRRARDTGDDAHAIPFLKRFTVFSTDQCDNLPDDLVTAPPPVLEGLILPEVEALIRASGADLRLGGDRAFYSPALDCIQVPRPDAYFEPVNWHRTVLLRIPAIARSHSCVMARSVPESSRSVAVTRSTWIGCQFRRWRSIVDGRFGAPQAFTFKFDTVCVVKEAVEDRVGVGGISYGVMPRGRGELAGHDGRLAAVPIFQDLQQVVPGLGIERLKAPVIQDEQLDAGEAFEPAGDTAVTPRDGKFVEQAGEADVEDRPVVAAGLVTDGAGEPTFSDACWTADREIVVRVDPLAAEQRFEQPALKPAGASVIDILRRCLMPQFGVAQARAEPLVVSPGGFPVEQQRQPLGMAERGGVAVLVEFDEGFGHTLEAKDVQLVERRVRQQDRSP